MHAKTTFSTDNFDIAQFRPHGRVDFKIDGNLILCEAFGPFDTELLKAIKGIETGLIRQVMEQGKWGQIVIMRENIFVSNEAVAWFGDYLKWLASRDMNSSSSAMVIEDDVEGVGEMVPLLVEAYKQAGLTMNVFKTLNEAKVWVKLHL